MGNQKVSSGQVNLDSDYDFQGELRKNGVDVVTIDSLPKTTVITSNASIVNAGSYFINGDYTITLADAALFADGESVVITPAVGTAPVVLAVTDGIKAPDGTLHDTVNFDKQVTVTFVVNNSKWEV